MDTTGGDRLNSQHNPEQLVALVAGLLNDEEAQAAEKHAAECTHCRRELTELREVDSALRNMLSELFLDGPPPDGALVLQRALRQIRRESRARWKRQRRALIAAAVVAFVGVGAAGVALGWSTAGESNIEAPAQAGSRLLTGFNQSTGTRLSATLTPDIGWVGVKATITGLSVGERCMLVVVDRRGNPYILGSWFVDAPDETYNIDSGVALAQGDIAAVAVRNFPGRELVIAPA